VLDVLRDVVASFRHEHAYEITTSNSVADAFGILQRESFDLILLDMVMPRIGNPVLRRQGLDVLKRVRELGVQTPIVMMSGDLRVGRKLMRAPKARSAMCISRSMCGSWTASSQRPSRLQAESGVQLED
jgi:CheY-like chemotaxis protein